MALLEDHTASFIVRIWREQGDYGSGSREWRGSIEHVGSGQKAFFRDLAAIVAFMSPHLDALGINPANAFWDRMDASLESAPATRTTIASPADSPPAAEPLREQIRHSNRTR